VIWGLVYEVNFETQRVWYREAVT